MEKPGHLTFVDRSSEREVKIHFLSATYFFAQKLKPVFSAEAGFLNIILLKSDLAAATFKAWALEFE